VSGGKRRGDHGDLDGASTLDRGGRGDGRQRAFMVAGSGWHGRRCSGELLVEGRGGGRPARRRELHGEV
jgi:hypothetical protein